MAIQFNIEGPETRKARELDQRLRELQVKNLQAQIEKEDPTMRGSAIDASMAVLQDPNATTGAKAAAYARLGELGGMRQVEGLGNVPIVIPEEQINEGLMQRTDSMAQRLAVANRKIQEARAAGDENLATAYEASRDMQFKNAKENWKKLPIKQAEDLVEYKNLINLGAKAIETTSPYLYGPVAGRVQAGLASIGQSPDFTTMNQAYSGLRNQILNKMAGSAVTEQEAARLLQQVGDPYSGDFAQRLKTFTNQRRREYLDKLQAYQEAGYEIPQSLRLGSSYADQQQPQLSQQGGNVIGSYSIDPKTGQPVRNK
jgi:hypothetical protein